MNKKTGHAGFSIFWLLVTLGACVLSGYLLGAVAAHMPNDKPVMPLLIMGLLLAPMTLVTQLIFKFNDMKKLKGINRDEKRRLEAMVDAKVLRLILIDVFYLVSTSVVGVLFYVSPFFLELNLITWTLRAAGFLLVAAAVTSVKVLLDTRKISNFEARISNRAQERKTKAALLKRLKHNAKS
ncbi:hypothetical protein [Pseudomonas sp. NFPP28]|uniref:hypothetical protein n=1 Tax=Pseudomonas sp. NFPP28 TaxID=1566231 RepID=UPI0008DF5D5D|nr:hypothetical protein [Pseudomonas sp. NFPP28]SFQ06126.1 hypothetical protein SAMN03159315_05666 [Pseudomonas sp. NFPP28]